MKQASHPTILLVALELLLPLKGKLAKLVPYVVSLRTTTDSLYVALKPTTTTTAAPTTQAFNLTLQCLSPLYSI